MDLCACFQVYDFVIFNNVECQSCNTQWLQKTWANSPTPNEKGKKRMWELQDGSKYQPWAHDQGVGIMKIG